MAKKKLGSLFKKKPVQIITLTILGFVGVALLYSYFSNKGSTCTGCQQRKRNIVTGVAETFGFQVYETVDSNGDPIMKVVDPNDPTVRI